MPWTISTFAGLKANGIDSNWRVAGFELFRALNERQAAIGFAKTQFYKADGSQASDVTYAQLDGLKTSVGAGGRAITNMTRLQSGITAMVTAGRFTVASGRSTAWSLATLEAAIGTSLHDAPDGPVDTRFWQAQKDALDLLIYAKQFVFTSSDLTGLDDGGHLQNSAPPSPVPLPGSTPDFTIEDAWADALGAFPTYSSPYNCAWGGHVYYQEITGYAPFIESGAEIRTPTSVYVPNGTFSGVLTDVDFTVRASAHKDNLAVEWTDDLVYEIGSGTLTLSPFIGANQPYTVAGAAADIAAFGAGGNCVVTLSHTPPATCPFTYTFGGDYDHRNGGMSIGVGPYLATYFFDIAAELTDQA